MQVTVQLPDNIAKLIGDTASIPKALLEALAAESYRTHKISRHQVSELLGLDYWKTEDFLHQNEAQRPYTLADLKVDRQSLAGLPEK